MKTTKTITVTPTTTEEIDIEFPIYLKESDFCVYALFSPTEIWEVCHYPTIKKGTLSKPSADVAYLYTKCNGQLISESEYVTFAMQTKTAIRNAIADLEYAFNDRNEVEDGEMDATDGKDLKYDRMEYEAIQKAEVDR